MKSKIVQSFVLIAILFLIGYAFNLINYGANQEFAKVATQQVNNDDSFYVLKSKGFIFGMGRIICVVAFLFWVYLFYRIWTKK